MTERDIIRRLQDSPVPPPPEDLAARIINDIPDDIEVHPDLVTTMPDRRFIHRRPVWLAAAAAAAVALTAAVTWELRHERPTSEMLSQYQAKEMVDHEDGLETPSADADRTDTASDSGDAVGLEKTVNTWSQLGAEGDTAAKAEAREKTAERSSGVSTDTASPRQAPGRDALEDESVLAAVPQAEAKDERLGEEELARRTTPESQTTKHVMIPDATPDEPAPEKSAIAGNLEHTLEKRLPRGKAPTMPTPPPAPTDGTRSQRELAGGPSDPITMPGAPASSSVGERGAENQLAAVGSTRKRSAVNENEELDTGQRARTEVLADEMNFISPPVEPPPPEPAPVVITSTAGIGGVLKQDASASTPSTGGTAEPNDKPYGDVFFEHSGVNPFVDSEDDALSTFGLDVDTGSFTVARRYLHDGNLPPREAIRVEEFVNFFDYGDTAPRRDDFRLIAEGAPSAFMRGERYYTLRLAVKAREVDAEDRPSAVLVFCVDVSGSMARENRLELVKKALYELLENLRRDDYVGLVVYGSTGEVLLRPTTNHDEIRRAIDRLRSGGSTNAEDGLSLAYDLLDDGESDGRIRRVILCSDGVANVGRTGPESILERIRRETGEGIELTTVGFGMGNYNDTLMEQLADAGDGRYAYVDDLTEARRIFVEELTGTLFTLGREAKAQVEFDPAVVSRWRLLGYENRDIADERFRDPTVDAGEIGAGHTVTAVYEVKLREDVSRSDTVATLRFRYRPVGQDDAVEMEQRLRVGDLTKSWQKASPSLKLASLVAEFAELLKGTYWAKDGDLEEVLERLQHLQSDFAGDARVAELTGLVARAKALQPVRAEVDNR